MDRAGRERLQPPRRTPAHGRRRPERL